MRRPTLAGIGKRPTAQRCLPPLGGAATGPDPTNRGKLGTKRHVLSDRRGAPLGGVLSGANRTDMQLAEAVLDSVVVERPTPTGGHPPHLCQDKGFDYTATDQAAQARGYRLHTARKRRRGQPRAPVPAEAARHPARRWVIERDFAWMNGYGKLRRCTKRCPQVVDFYVFLAAALVVVRQLLQWARLRYRWPTRPTARCLK
jgi:DDE family transposase